MPGLQGVLLNARRVQAVLKAAVIGMSGSCVFHESLVVAAQASDEVEPIFMLSGADAESYGPGRPGRAMDWRTSSPTER
jgi:hypothetical protein